MTEAAEKSVSFRAWVAVIGGLFGCFMAGMNVHVTSAALPEIEGSLGATFEEGSWISTAYLVAEIVMIPLTAWLVQVFSLRRVMLVGSFGGVQCLLLGAQPGSDDHHSGNPGRCRRSADSLVIPADHH